MDANQRDQRLYLQIYYPPCSASRMSVSQEREEAASHSKTLSSGAMEHRDINDLVPTTDYEDEGGQGMPRSSSPVPSGVSMKSNKSIQEGPDFSNEQGTSDANPLRASGLQPTLGDEHRDIDNCSRHLWTEHTPKTQNKGNSILRRVKEKHKAGLKRRFENISEGIIKPGAETPLNMSYTELYITEGECEEVNQEHEVWQMELASRVQTSEDTPINCNDIFRPLPGQEKHIRTVLTKGVAGIGKTVSVQKFILDWIDGVANHDVDFVFPLSFREMNLIRDDEYSLHRLLLEFHPELKELRDGEVYKDCQVVFIFDGLDERRTSPNVQPNVLVSDVKQTSSVDILIMSLIQGTLFPSALIWITSRPAAASQLPAQYISRVTKIRGFNDQQKIEYFRKRISDESQANQIISHIERSRSLHIMCHIPIFCWIAATVFQQMLEQKATKEIPKTLTEMFVNFLLIQIAKKDEKYQTGAHKNMEQLLESQKDIILKLTELAFRHLQKSNVMFYEEDLRECGIDVSESSVYSGMCTEIFKEESVFQQKKVYCFVHLSIQEFLAALHVFVSYSNQMKTIGQFSCLKESLKLAVTKVLASQNGHLDLFLRFLMGISVERNQRLLKGFLTHIHNTSRSIEETCQYIKELNKDDLSPDRCISLLQCLSEVNDNFIHEEIQQYLKSPNSSKQKLSPAHCSTLAQMLLMSGDVLDDFDLKKYNTSDDGRRRLIPAVRCCRKAHLHGCQLNKMSYETLKRCLQSANSLIHLDLSHNLLEDSGVHILSAGLTSPQCKLQRIRLSGCRITDKSCEIVATVLQSPNSLTELDLSHNDLGDSGVQLLSKGLVSPHCKLETLRLSGCLVSGKGCGFLASALTSNPSHLKELDLSYNHPGESGLKLLSARLEDPVYKLETLNVDHCSKIRLSPGVRKYACKLTLNPNTAHRKLSLFDGNSKLKCLQKGKQYPAHPERFDHWAQVLCREGLSECCYWEAEWSGYVTVIAVAYKSIERKVKNEAHFGYNAKSWSLVCSPLGFSAWHNKKDISIPAPSPGSRRVGVYLDWPAGTLSFYSVSSDTLTHLHTFHSTFTKPLYPGFWIWEVDASISLCKMQSCSRVTKPRVKVPH